jgi:hypothetical protein
MLVRMVAGVLHPFIHTGFGLEFKDVVVLAEGYVGPRFHADSSLAEAAIHDHGIMHQLFPLNWPEDELSPQTGTKAETKKDEWGQAVPASSSSGPSLLEIYGEFASNDRLAPPAYNPNHMINDRLKAATGEGRAKELVSLAQKWNLDDEAIGDGPNGFERRLEEVAVLVTLVACASGRSDKPAKIDFFLVHYHPFSDLARTLIPDACVDFIDVPPGLHVRPGRTAPASCAADIPPRCSRYGHRARQARNRLRLPNAISSDIRRPRDDARTRCG